LALGFSPVFVEECCAFRFAQIAGVASVVCLVRGLIRNLTRSIFVLKAQFVKRDRWERMGSLVMRDIWLLISQRYRS
jgi:hypothetical protein